MVVKKKIILCFVKYYLPGFRFGGPVRSIANFVENLGDEYDIHIVCLSHDGPDTLPYKNVVIDEWNQVGKAKVFYVSNKITKFSKIFKLLRETKYNVLYLNSFFSFTFTIFPLITRYLNLISLKPCIIAPRGEFAKNAIKLKKIKKLTYISFVKIIGLYNNLRWQASSNFEYADILRELGDIAKVINVAPDLISSKWSIQKKIPKRKMRIFKIVFLSRISPMKNLDFLIKVLTNVSSSLELSILGPKEDLQYWKKCKKLIKKLPHNIKVNIGNAVLHKKIQDTFSKYDLFAFPTRGESFGHVIPEALSAGTPILLSNQTSWQKNNSSGLQILPLNKNVWCKAIQEWVKLPYDKLIKRKQAALRYAHKIKLKNKKSILKNKQLFKVLPIKA